MRQLSSRGLCQLALVCVLLLAAAPPARAQDNDGDGMSDVLERVLAMDYLAIVRVQQ